MPLRPLLIAYVSGIALGVAVGEAGSPWWVASLTGFAACLLLPFGVAYYYIRHPKRG